MRLIDADAVLRSLPDDLPYKDSVRRVLMQAATVDAAPIVWCKKCEFWGAWKEQTRFLRGLRPEAGLHACKRVLQIRRADGW